MYSVWRNCIERKNISHGAKYQIFRTAALSILFYGAQVWGYISFEAVEKFLRFFIRNTFKLPGSSPNYMLYLETGIAPLFLDTLKIHFDYVTRVMAMGEERIPRLVLMQLIHSGGTCVTEWNKLANESSADFTVSTTDNNEAMKLKFKDLLRKVGNMIYNKFTTEAESSQYRTYYSKLNHFLNTNTYFLAQNSTEQISMLFKIRGEVIGLNYIPHRPELPLLCDLCNLKVREDVFHFVGICPILKEFRRRFFAVESLSLDEVIKILNGESGWDPLVGYITKAFRYRNQIMQENF